VLKWNIFCENCKLRWFLEVSKYVAGVSNRGDE